MEYKELSWRERGRLWLRLGIRLVLTVLAVLILVYLAPPLLSLLMPFVLALVMAWVLNPAIRAVQKKLGVSRKLLSVVALLVLFVVLGGTLTALVYSVASELVALAGNWQSIWNSALETGRQIGDVLSGVFTHLPPELVETVEGVTQNLIEWLKTTVPTLLSSMASGAGSVALRVPTFAMASVIFVMGSYFITSDYPRLRFLFLEHLSTPLHQFLGDVKRTAVAAFGGYVKAQFILSVAVFFILLVGFILIGQPYSVLLAFLLAVLDFIPIIGAGTVMIPWSVICLFTRDLRGAIELMVIWGVIALFRRVAEPKIVGDQTGLSPILSLVSIYVGMKLAGVPGMVLGPVLCMVGMNIAKLGVFSGVTGDVRLAVGDLTALLKDTPPGPPGQPKG